MSDDINVNYIADQLAKKVDLPDNKGQDGIDYVVEWKAPTEADPTWYRVYKSGWVEQGGYISWSNNPLTEIALLKNMSNAEYCIYVQQIGTTQDSTNSVSITARNINKFTLVPYTNNRQATWQVSGQGA